MLADDGADAKARWQVAVEAAIELIDGLRSRGGHRVSVTVFAARATTIVPLTTDYDHAKSKLAELNGRYPPSTIRPDRDDFPSGTRIGAGLAAAIGTFDSRTGRTRDVLMFSDGDDPAGDDEWRGGLAAARRADVPVHVVGIGDPNQSSLIPLGRDVLEFTGPDDRRDVVRTTLNETPLTTIASESRGQYLAARRKWPDWTPFLRDVVEGGVTRELADWQLPQKQSRAAGFFLAAAGLIVLGWLSSVRGVASRTASAVG
jgi:Ca-activated chloride channel family protein